MKNCCLITGNANRPLAESIAEQLRDPLADITVGAFSDGEVKVELNQNVRGKNCYILQSICGNPDTSLMELLLLTDALKRASAESITAVIPYFGYARQDRRPRSARVPISARVVANLLQQTGVDRVLTVDIHSEQTQGFFDIPVDNIYAMPHFVKYAREVINGDIEDWVSVSPDMGGVVRARAFAKELNIDLCIIDKRRPNPNESEIMHIIGDVEGKSCVIIDDMVDTAGTLCNAADELKKRGAEKVVALCTHGVLSGPAYERIANSALDQMVVTDTIPTTFDTNAPYASAANDKIRIVSIADILAESIRRIHNGESLSQLFAG